MVITSNFDYQDPSQKPSNPKFLTCRPYSLPAPELYAKFTSDTAPHHPRTRNESLRPDKPNLNNFTIPLDSELAYATTMSNSDHVKRKPRAEEEGVKHQCNGPNVRPLFTPNPDAEGARAPAALARPILSTLLLCCLPARPSEEPMFVGASLIVRLGKALMTT